MGRLIPTAALLSLAVLAGCSPTDHGGETSPTKPQDTGAMARRAAAAPDTSGWCAAGNDGGRRLNDLAEHVHDTAVAEYLRQNVVAFGRKSTPQDGLYAMMLLNDGASYETRVTVPERCLRTELQDAVSNAERDALLTGKGAYAYERALACLQRAGDAYTARKPAPDFGMSDAAVLDAAYRERILPHLVGDMMPVALLGESNYFGADNAELHEAAVNAWHECYESLARRSLDPSELVRRVSMDKIASLDCAEAFHEKMWSSTGPPTPASESP